VLAGLLFNGIVIDCVFVQEVEDVEVNEETSEDEEDDNVNESVVFDFVADTSELDMLYQHFADHAPFSPVPFQPYIELPDIRNTPFNEFNRSQPLLSLAFPGLYPEGQGEFVQARQWTIGYVEYIQHCLKYEDGQFARHPRFRYVVFNTLARLQINNRSNFFVKRHEGEY